MAGRQLVLDTETTGIGVEQGHRIIEIGVIELINRRPTGKHYHRFVNPQREVEEGAMQVHGITNEFLADKPLFSELAQDLWDWLAQDELIIHNAPFDVGFLDKEFSLAGIGSALNGCCVVTDTLKMARKMHPGQKASLDALCRRYGVDNSNRELHGALLDARLLADVYLAMTGGQSALTLDSRNDSGSRVSRFNWNEKLGLTDQPLLVLRPTEEEQSAHIDRLRAISKGSDLVWDGEITGDG